MEGAGAIKVWNGPLDRMSVGWGWKEKQRERERGHKRSITMKNGVISRCLLAPALSSLFGNGTFPLLSLPAGDSLE